MAELTKQEALEWFKDETIKRTCWGKKYRAYMRAIEVLERSIAADKVAETAFKAFVEERRAIHETEDKEPGHV